MPIKKITANRGASLSRQSVIAKLRRDRKNGGFILGEYITSLIEWIDKQSIRAARKPGGLGRR